MHIFISYSTENLDFAQNVYHELIRRGFEVWIDELTPEGEDWRSEIDDALNNAYAVCLIMTPSAFTSYYVTYEWAYALGRGVPVIPILREKTEFHARLAGVQRFDFTTRNRPWDDLAERLNAVRDQRDPVTDDNLLDSLRSRQPETRDAAILRLRRRADAGVLPIAEGVLFPTDRNYRYSAQARMAAVEALGAAGENALDVLIRALAHNDREVKREAASKITALGEYAVPAVLNLLDSSDPDLRLRATWILGEIGSPDAVTKLAEHLDDADHLPTVRKRVSDGAAEALTDIGTPDALVHAVRYWGTLLNSKRKHWTLEGPLSDYAAERLYRIKTPAAKEALKRYKKDAVE